MSSDRIFSIIGDANVKRNMTQLNVASREAMKSAQVIECISLSTLDAALQEVRVLRPTSRTVCMTLLQTKQRPPLYMSIISLVEAEARAASRDSKCESLRRPSHISTFLKFYELH